MTPPAPPSPARLRLLFAPVTPEQARLFAGIGRMLDRRGVAVRFGVPHAAVGEPLRDAWDGLIDVPGPHASVSNDTPRPGALSNRAGPNPGVAASAPAIGAYDAWRSGWTEPQRAAAAAEALAFWNAALRTHPADALVVWNGRDHVFVEAAVASARDGGVEPLFMELGPLRQAPMTVAIARNGVNAAAAFRRPELLDTPLSPLEARHLAAARGRFRAGLGPGAAPAEPRSAAAYAFLPLQVDDDTQLFYYMPHFADQPALVRAVVAALPPDLPLLLKLHPLADERRGRALYEPLLRPHDRITSPRSSTLDLLAGAALVITNNSSAGVEALLLDRPLVVLGTAHFRGRGFTFDYGRDAAGAAQPAFDSLSDAIRAALRAAQSGAAALRRDRYLYELLFHELVHVDAHPLQRPLGEDELQRLALRLLDLLTPLELNSDWLPVFGEVTALHAQLGEAVHSVMAAGAAPPLLLASAAACAALGPDASIAPQRLEHALDEPGRIRGRSVALLAPDLPPGQRAAAVARLRAAGAASVRDLQPELARVPCGFHTARFNALPPALRDELYRRGDYWDYYLTQSGIRPADSPAKQAQAATIAAALAGHAPRSVLEYGCGDGRILTALLADAVAAGRQLTGVDACERMLTLARQRLPSNANVHLTLADGRDRLPFSAAGFDATLTCGALQHVHADELPRVITELHRVTRSALLHWEAFEALQPAAGEHYTNPQTSRALHTAVFERYGPLAATIRDARPLSGQPALFCEYRLTQPLITVLTLHAVAPPPAEVESYDYRNMFLAPDAFAEILDSLRAAGWSFITLSEAAAAARGAAATPPKALVLTFDDGYASVFDAAFPLLRDRGLRGAAFIPTDFIGGAFAGNTRHGGGPARPTMTAGQLRSLRAAGWDIGAHSASHPVFAGLDDGAVRRELESSRAALAAILGEPTPYFAFPYGEPGAAFTPGQAQRARDCGFEIVLSTQPAFVNPGEARRHGAVWPRIAVNHDETPATLLASLARIHRETHGWPAPAALGPTLSERVRRAVQHCVKHGARRIALYGAGQHTARLLQSTPLWPLDVQAIVDDDARLNGARRYGLPICGPAQLPALNIDAVLISSDRYEHAIFERLSPLAARGIHVLRLYANEA